MIISLVVRALALDKRSMAFPPIWAAPCKVRPFFSNFDVRLLIRNVYYSLGFAGGLNILPSGSAFPKYLQG